MKKLLSYLLGWAFAVLPRFIVGNVQADCDCPDGDLSCQKACYYESEEYKENNTPESKKCWWSCEDGIKLNTCFPIIWDCIKTWAWKTNATQAFPTMIGALTKIIMALVLIVCFIFVIIAGIKRASDDPKTARSIIIKVGITVLLLWFSWVILRLINPNFFGWWFI